MLYDPTKLLLIAGPSLLESEKLVLSIAEELARLQAKHASTLRVVFKGSFDKPYRSSLFSARGIGLTEGLQLLGEVKEKYGLPVMTDVHERHQVEPISELCDAIQIPSTLSRHNDLLIAAAHCGRAVNVRKAGQMSPEDAVLIAEKMETSHVSELWITERGTSFGYGNYIVDMRSFAVMKRADTPLIIDGTSPSLMPLERQALKTDAVQFVAPLCRAGIAAGANGLYLDVHPEPQNALVDTATHIPLARLAGIVEDSLSLWQKLQA